MFWSNGIVRFEVLGGGYEDWLSAGMLCHCSLVGVN